MHFMIHYLKCCACVSYKNRKITLLDKVATEDLGSVFFLKVNPTIFS